ncbi:hypothetical protein X566_08970 [Afipia sp. P52-10]|jgi:hypothetical protein|uniref:NrsF family protein n=1 Tax=Afipia sp. P52-10 TaxID=1429916 RepID=UPI0003DF155C|nr:DUF1109 domain-containing protein [Afipia sp. P52-10]ETR77763.1 hypothetical protein X566_08970 [Afipia sp. P52-10]
MRTDDLIADLGAAPPPLRLIDPTWTVLGAVLLSCLAVATIAFAWLGLGRDIENILALRRHEFLINLAFVVSVGSVAMAIVRDLAIPGKATRLPARAVVVPFVLIAAVAAHEAGTATLHHDVPHADGASWLTCLWQTSMLALPPFAILAFGIRRLAPTDLRRAGFYVGLLAGAIGSMGFCLHAPAGTVAFGATVYTGGILGMAMVGGWIGPRLLRWR